MIHESYKIESMDINLLPVSIAVYKKEKDDFIFLDFNKHAEESDNINKEELLGRRVTEVFPGVKEFGLFDVFLRVHKTKKNEKFELAYYKDDRSEGWKVNDVIANPDGTIMAIYQDVTNDIHKEQQMNSFGALIDSSDNEYYTFDKDTLKFNYCNHSACKNLGYTFQEIRNITPVCIKPKFTTEDFKKILQPLIENSTKQVVFSAQHCRKDGTLYDVEARVQLMELDSKEQFVATVLDVTQRKILEHSLETFGIIVNNSLNEVYIFDHDSLKFTYVNKSTENNLGYNYSEILNMTAIDIKPEQTKESFLELLSPLESDDEKQIVLECNHQRKDGTTYPVEARIQLMNIQGHLSYVVIASDITVKKENQKKLEEQQTIMLSQSKMASMGEMLGNIAHQWRQPLTVISTISSGLNLTISLNQYDEKFAVQNLKKIVDVTQHLSDTIDDFRNFFEPNKETTVFSLEDIYIKNMSILSVILELSEIKIVTNFEDVYVQGYDNEMTQVLLNILNNAKDVLIKLKQKRVIFIDIYKDDTFGIITIKDNGGGIPDDIKDKVFEPYFTTKHKSQGTGIGLYMSEQIISKHMKGFIEVNNEEYEYEDETFKGAQFTIKVPLKGN